MLLEEMEDAVQRIYDHIRESFILALEGVGLNPNVIDEIVTTVDDAASNNFDVLVSELDKSIEV